VRIDDKDIRYELDSNKCNCFNRGSMIRTSAIRSNLTSQLHKCSKVLFVLCQLSTIWNKITCQHATRGIISLQDCQALFTRCRKSKLANKLTNVHQQRSTVGCARTVDSNDFKFKTTTIIAGLLAKFKADSV
jgi:hypothetical protein